VTWFADVTEWLWTTGCEVFAGWYAPALAAVCLLQYCVYLHRLIVARREAQGYRREMEGLAVELAGSERERTLSELENAILRELVSPADVEQAIGLLLRRFVPDTRSGLGVFLELREGAYCVRLGRGLSEQTRRALQIDPALLEQLRADALLVLQGDALAHSGLLDGMSPPDRQKIRELFVIAVGDRHEPAGIVLTTSLYPPSAERDQQIELARRIVRSLGEMLLRLAEQRAVERQARFDGLTDLANRREFDREIVRWLDAAVRSGGECSLLMIDLDRFKAVNDTYGHVAGDAVLRGIADLLRAQTCRMRSDDRILVARYGGEEIAVVLPDIGAAGAVRIAELIREAVAAHEFDARGRTLRVTVSVGVATFPTDASTADALIVAADEALYDAKSRGRNRVCTARRLAETVTDEEPCDPADEPCDPARVPCSPAALGG
jgi:diguanylate cyclase (GGDEF)-like protein